MADKQIDLQKATADWIAAILQYYSQFDNLTQVHARGHFAGMSEREILALADHLADNQKKYPINRGDWRWVKLHGLVLRLHLKMMLT